MPADSNVPMLHAHTQPCLAHSRFVCVCLQSVHKQIYINLEVFIYTICGGPTHIASKSSPAVQAAASTHIPAASAQSADTSMHRKRQATLSGSLHMCTHQEIHCRSTSKNPLPEPDNARHSFLIPMHTHSARHSLARRTRPADQTCLPQDPFPTTASTKHNHFPIGKVLRAAAAPRITE